ncbi:TetR/AcrR family transcriptional regulator [Cryobacterium frigoriphilum]|uniref:TetR/AcrR family transcriptional regulator n=1 Tax=Cryobacterium frigoriphilum TaxID=1259150 RepID=A0A4R8ZXC3_9MICO|nr:TetR/AcrR family transcriptional regulator [Cryobacterium frigoriphilum]TFD48297.1 TetR/AcrR family transcriptional regulator [Cryobacterium frigoriphilum]
MSNAVPARRYAKGEAKRREILAAALQLIAESGYRNSTLQDVADAVGLTKAGVLHYFESREDLITQVLQGRDDHDAVQLAQEARAGAGDREDDMLTLLSRAIRLNASVPGMVQLYSRVVVEAEDPQHPAHDYISERYELVAARIAASVQQRQSLGTARADLDPAQVARIVIAVSDGLQLQWMHARDDIDMSVDFDAALTLILGPA